MTQTTLLWLLAGLAAAQPARARSDTAATESAEIHAVRALAPADSPDHRKYAPSRLVDIRHLALDVTPDFGKRTIEGRAAIRFRPVGLPLREWKLDAVDLDISKVRANEPVEAWRNTDTQLIVTFAREIPTDTDVTLEVAYAAAPREGLYFRTPELGYPESDTHLFTQGEAIHHRHWFPCFDAPNERFTSEVTCRVPPGMTVLSNGSVVSAKTDPDTGLIAVRWVQEQTHVNYLIALAAGYFEKLERSHREVPLTFWTPPSMFEYAANSFAGTQDMMAFFEGETGVPYPWAKYAQVCVTDFVAGGMENTGLTILTHRTLFPEETENLRGSQGLVAHELAHQWFGDLVTCKDWSHLWLNEGFATYYEHLYARHADGRDAFLWRLHQSAERVLGEAKNLRPIVWREYDQPNDQFSFLAYPKGAWVLHMLRSQLGEELYRRCIRTYLERHRFGTVVTEDLNRVLEELSGRSFDQFFDQWVYHGGVPNLEVSYSWDQRSKLARLSVRQTQEVNEQALLFQFSLPVRFRTPAGEHNEVMPIEERSSDFEFPLPEAPASVRIDPEFTVLAKIDFQPPRAMLLAQLEDDGDMLGRVLAVRALAGKDDVDTVERFRRVLRDDPFHAVRVEAAKALGAARSDEALEALLASTEQADAQVRRAVWSASGDYYREEVGVAARRALDSETNPDIAADLIRLVAVYPSDEINGVLVDWLGRESFRDGLTEAAFRAMRSRDDPAFIDPVMALLRKRGDRLEPGVHAAGLQALAHLSRGEEDKTDVRELLQARLDHRHERVRRAALAALGALGDPRAIPVVETFTRAPEDKPERQAADRALSALRDERKPGVELKALREEVLALQRENRELRRELDELAAKVEKTEQAVPPPAEKEKRTRPRRKRASE